jgi:hypothetical protein
MFIPLDSSCLLCYSSVSVFAQFGSIILPGMLQQVTPLCKKHEQIACVILTIMISAIMGCAIMGNAIMGRAMKGSAR